MSTASVTASLANEISFAVSYTIATELRTGAVDAGATKLELITVVLVIGILLSAIPAAMERFFDVLLFAARSEDLRRRVLDPTPGPVQATGRNRVDRVDRVDRSSIDESVRQASLWLLDLFGQRRRRLAALVLRDLGEVELVRGILNRTEGGLEAVQRAGPGPRANALVSELFTRARSLEPRHHEKSLSSFVLHLIGTAQRITGSLLVQLVAAAVITGDPIRSTRIVALLSVAVFFLFLQGGAIAVWHGGKHAM